MNEQRFELRSWAVAEVISQADRDALAEVAEAVKQALESAPPPPKTDLDPEETK